MPPCGHAQGTASKPAQSQNQGAVATPPAPGPPSQPGSQYNHRSPLDRPQEGNNSGEEFDLAAVEANPSLSDTDDLLSHSQTQKTSKSSNW